MNEFEKFFSDDPWEQINQPCYPDGRRLYLNDNRFWVSMDSSNNLVFFIHEDGINLGKTITDFSNANVEISNYGASATRLKCTLLDQGDEIREKFSIVAKDVAFSCSKNSGKELFAKALNRIKSWSAFLKPKRTGLTDSEYLGFFGELFLFNNHILKAFKSEDAIRYWVGPEMKKQDFTFDDIAIDVKSTMSGTSNLIKISSLDQLNRITTSLYLLRLIFSPASANGGYTLSQLYEESLAVLRNQFDAKLQFLLKTSALYGKASAEQLNNCLLLVNKDIFEVRDGFPCLTRDKIPSEIADVSYSIYVSRISSFSVDKGIDELIKNG